MTDEQILKLSETCGFDSLAGKLTTNTYWKCEQEQLLKFALAIYENGYNKGYCEGYESGSTGVFGEPLG